MVDKIEKSFQYEVKWKYWLPKYNSWVPKEVLLEHGFDKLIQKFDDHEASREGLGYRELTPSVIRKHFEDVGLMEILLIIPQWDHYLVVN